MEIKEKQLRQTDAHLYQSIRFYFLDYKNATFKICFILLTPLFLLLNCT